MPPANIQEDNQLTRSGQHPVDDIAANLSPSPPLTKNDKGIYTSSEPTNVTPMASHTGSENTQAQEQLGSVQAPRLTQVETRKIDPHVNTGTLSSNTGREQDTENAAAHNYGQLDSGKQENSKQERSEPQRSTFSNHHTD